MIEKGRIITIIENQKKIFEIVTYFEFGDSVFHIYKQLGKGIILNWKLDGKTGTLQYKINFQYEDKNKWYNDVEIKVENSLWNLIKD